MFRPTRVLPALLPLALLLFAPAVVRADPLTINSGSVVSMTYVAGSWRIGSYDIRWAQDSYVRGNQTDQSGQSSQLRCNAPCGSGSVASVTGSSNLPTSVPGSFFIPGTLPIDPNVNPALRSIGGRFNGSLLSFTSGTFVMPDGPATNDGLIAITTQFTASGTIIVQNISGVDNSLTQVFAGDFIGSGTATFTFGYVSSFLHVLELKSARYRFDGGGFPQPVPEPSTLVLLGSGVAGLAARQRRRSRRRKLQEEVS